MPRMRLSFDSGDTPDSASGLRLVAPISTRHYIQWFILFAVCLFFTEAVAQSNEFSLAAGVYTTRHVQMKNDQMFAIQGTAARQIAAFHRVDLHLELPIAASLDNRAKATAILKGQLFATRHYAAMFITPGIRLSIFPESGISPHLVAGFGLAHFSMTGGVSSTNTNVFDFGAGIDARITRRFALRTQLRDYYSGAPQLITGLRDREHQIMATGGVAFRF